MSDRSVGADGGARWSDMATEKEVVGRVDGARREKAEVPRPPSIKHQQTDPVNAP